MDNPISWDYLSTVPGPNEVFGPLAILYLIVFAAGFIVSLLIYNNQAKQLFPNPVAYRLVRKWAGWALVAFGAGLFFFLIRALQINPFTFAMRFWMWVTVLSVMAIVVLIMVDFKRYYAKDLAAWNARKQREEYMKAYQTTPSAKKSGAATMTANPRPVKKKRKTV